MPTTLNVVSSIILKGMEIFSDERKRNFQQKYVDLLTKIKGLENRRAPDYNDAELGLAREELDIFLAAYEKEFQVQLDTVLRKVGSNA